MKLPSIQYLIDRFLRQYIGFPVDEKAIKKNKLVMTLLARDEADVIESNIQFHLQHGVDFIVATDNGSSDGTTEIFEKYAHMGVLHLIHEPSRIFDQASWVNRMGRYAHAELGANLIFHCDADEFWYPRSGSLKHELLTRPWADILLVNVVNCILRSKNGREVFPDDAIYAATNPLPRKTKREGVRQEWETSSFLLFRHLPKVIYKLSKGYYSVGQGNHRIEKRDALSLSHSQDISIYHFPVRGFSQFARRTVNHGEGQENRRKISDTWGNTGWHNARWFGLYNSGRLFEEYSRLNLSEGEAEKQLRKRIITTEDPGHKAVLAYLSKKLA